MRLFVALDIASEIRERITAFRNQMRVLAPEVRWVGPETFHVTLQVLGETKKLESIRRALPDVKSGPVQISFRGTGFFPHPRAPRVFWVGIQSDEQLQILVGEVGSALQPLGFHRDAGPYAPHLTLARSGSGRSRPVSGERSAPGLQRVREQLATMPQPDFGTMMATEFCLYESHLSPAGARYEKRALYPLR
jgi:2'-5' RNA ligase